MKKYWIKYLTDKQAIHAPTKEIALKLCGRFHELGLKWCSGRSYLDVINWLEHEENTCYEPTIGMYCSREYYEYSKYEILTIDQLYDFDEPEIEIGDFVPKELVFVAVDRGALEATGVVIERAIKINLTEKQREILSVSLGYELWKYTKTFIKK